jgi:SAF domain
VAMSPSPPARRLGAARWLDTRLLIGVFLVLGSVMLGAKVVAEADDSVAVWAARADLAPGDTLDPDDVETRQVRMADPAAYVGGELPTGYVLTRPVGSGELLPRAAVALPGDAESRRIVTVPVERHHFPGTIAAGERVDVYVTPASAGAQPIGPPEQVLAKALVDGVDADGARFGGGTGAVGVALAVAPADVPALVAAIQRGAIDLVRVPQDET